MKGGKNRKDPTVRTIINPGKDQYTHLLYILIMKESSLNIS
jgi:hypothetical protein